MTPLLRRKHTNNFNVYDPDRDGVIRGADFALFAHAIAASRGLGPEAPEAAALTERFVTLWHGLAMLAGIPADGTLDLERYLGAMEALLADRALFLAGQELRVALAFDLFDGDGDGRVGAAEYATFLGTCGVDAGHAAAAFARLDAAGKGWLGRDEVVQLDLEFACSEDPEAPGNWLLGPF